MLISFRVGLVLRRGERTLEFVRELENDELQFEDCLSRRPSILSRSAVLKGIWSREYSVVLADGAPPPPGLAHSATAGDLDLSTLDEHVQRTIERRLSYVRALDAAHVSRGCRAAVVRVIVTTAGRLKDPSPPSASTVMGWARRFQQADRSPVALISGHVRRRQPRRLPQLVEDLIRRSLKEEYFTRAQHSLAHAHALIQTEATRLAREGVLSDSEAKVSMATLSRRVHDVDVYQRIASREGAARARMVCRTSMTGGAAQYPLQRVEVDHTILNWVVLCDRTGLPLGRPVLTVMLDAYSGYLLGFYLSFYGPGLTSLSGVIRNAVMPKDDFTANLGLQHRWLAHGVPDELNIDNGLEFHARVFKMIAWELGLALMYCRVRTPWLKPHIERFFAALNYLTLTRGRVRKSTPNVVSVDPKKDAAITFSDLVKGITMFAVDHHPFQINERKLARPFDLFEEGIERLAPARYPGSWDQLRLTSALSKTLTVGPGGVELRGLPYGGPELLQMRKRLGERFTTLVKWDPDNLREIYIQHPIDKSWVTSPCRWQDYASGLSWNQHLLIRRFARDELHAKGAYDELIAARVRLHAHWMEATSRRNRTDALQAARFSGVTSASVMGSDSSPEPLPPTRLLAAPEVTALPIDIPDFEAFELELKR